LRDRVAAAPLTRIHFGNIPASPIQGKQRPFGSSFPLIPEQAALILECMQQTSANKGPIGDESAFRNWSSPPPSSTSFAGLLASLTSSARGNPAEFQDDKLADDVATLSYEQALRTHVRYKPSAQQDGIAGHAGAGNTCSVCGALQGDPDSATRMETHANDLEWHEEPEVNSGFPAATQSSNPRKCASVTIRMSKGECEQLKKRAAEAGLTISAYLRSCTFEAEALRAEVKKTLAELRKPAHIERATTATEPGRSWFEWILRFMPRWHMVQRVARA